MSDYMFILESHLSPEQAAVLATVQNAAGEANLSLFLTGGAMRDMLGGFPIRDLDFTVEGPSIKFARDLAKKAHATVTAIDDHRKSAELLFPNGVSCGISMARQEKFGKPGAKPQVTPATIHEDLRGRDFTFNAIALSLNRASRGLMIDPTNGAADLERREIRAISNYSLYDDPVRLLRLVRFRARLGFTVDERTLQQFQNAREAGMENHIPPRALYTELREIALEPNPGDVLKALDDEKFARLFCPGLTGAKLNPAAFQKLAKAKAMIPFGAAFTADWYALTLNCLTQLLSPKEKAALIANTKMAKEEAAPWQKLEASAKKLETLLKSAKLHKASHVYDCLNKALGEQVLFLFLNSGQRIVQDRIRNHFTKYLPTAMEVSDAEVTQASGFEPGHAKFAKAREERIAAHLDGRIRKPAPPPEPEPAPATPGRGPIVRGSRFR
ncbi:MAG: CCA tRNA nucleotidyltransferase [Acidobacteria bacterium]|nr:CCA tRNA nucleotidyltransferase [Acidobacteriota bacterium]